MTLTNPSPKSVHAFNTGAIPKKDYRNFKVKEVLPFLARADVVEPFSLKKGDKLPVYYQGQKPACVGHAMCWLKMLLDYIDTGEVQDLSPRFPYAIAKSKDGIPDVDGTHPVVGAKVLVDYGICTNENFPNNINLPRDEYQSIKDISLLAYEEAEDAKAASFFEITDRSFKNLQYEIARNKVVCLLIRHGGEFYTDQQGNTTWDADKLFPMKAIYPIVSGHEVVAVSKDIALAMGVKNYRDDCIYFVNSFSSRWGEKGLGYFDASYIGSVKEALAFVDLPNAHIRALKGKRETILFQIKVLLQKALDGGLNLPKAFLEKVGLITNK